MDAATPRRTAAALHSSPNGSATVGAFALVKAIETTYKGYRFRSRLEARWAVFFDALGVGWQYEPQGFTNGADTYLPDFYLPESKTWVEVKGDPKALQSDWQRMVRLLDGCGVLPDFENSAGGYGGRGLLVLRDVPPQIRTGTWVHPMVRHRKGLQKEYGLFFPAVNNRPAHFGCLGPDSLLAHVFGVQPVLCLDSSPDGWMFEPVYLPTPYQLFPEVHSAYDAARAARFENGETPSYWAQS